MGQNRRADHQGPHRQAFDKNRKRILHSQEICAICGRPVDKSLRFPDPMSPTVDHIVPLAKGGHPSDLENLQLAHWICNRLKSDHYGSELRIEKQMQRLELTHDWSRF